MMRRTGRRDGDSVLPRKEPLRLFLDLGRIESEDRLRGLGGVADPCPFGLADLFMNIGWLSPLLDEGEARFDAGEDAILDRFDCLLDGSLVSLVLIVNLCLSPVGSWLRTSDDRHHQTLWEKV